MLSVINTANKIWLILILLTIYSKWFCLEAIAQSVNELPGLQWDHRFGDDRFEYEHQALALSSEGDEIWIAVGQWQWVNKRRHGNLLLWKINDKGKKIQEIEVKEPQNGKQPNERSPYLPTATAIAVAQNGDIFVVVEFGKSIPTLIRMDQTGKVLLEKKLSNLSNEVAMSKIIPMADGTFILIGAWSRKDALAMKIKGSGEILWKKVIDRGKLESFTDGFGVGKGSLVVGLSADVQEGMMAFVHSNLMILELDEKGEIRSEKSFPGGYCIMCPGKPGVIAKGQDGRYGIIYDKSGSIDQDIRVKVFDSALEEIWESPITTIKKDVIEFKIAPVPSGGFIIVGQKDKRPWVSRIDNVGKTVWIYSDITALSTIGRLMSHNDSFFLLQSSLNISKKERFRSEIRLIKFIQK
jgi:hypothetical protein